MNSYILIIYHTFKRNTTEYALTEHYKNNLQIKSYGNIIYIFQITTIVI